MNVKKNALFNDIKSNENISSRIERKTTDDISYISTEEYLANFSKNIMHPAVFKKAAIDWSCMTKWTDDFFAESMGDYPVEIIDNIGLTDKDSNYLQTDMKTFIRKLKKQEKAYLRVCRIIDDRPELKKDIDQQLIGNLVGGYGKGDFFYLFMGDAKTNTTTHSEMPTTVFIQVEGEKKWNIYAPEEGVFLNPVAHRMAYFFTRAKVNSKNNSDYPIIDFAKSYEVITQKGDILIIPPFYWHYVENLSQNVAIAFKHLDVPLAFKLSKTLSALFFLRTKPTIIESILYNKKRNYDVQVVMQGRKIKNLS